MRSLLSPTSLLKPSIPLSFPNSTLHTLSPLQNSSYLQLLESCTLNKNQHLGSQIHSNIITSGLETDSFLSRKLIAFYSHFKDLPTAKTIFRRFPNCNVFLLNSMIRGFSSNGLYQEAIALFCLKRREGLEPDAYTFSCVLKACASLSNLRQAKQLHEVAIQSGFDSDVFVSHSLISMYAKCGSLENSTQVFDRMSQRDVVSWNSIISAFALYGFDVDAVEKVREMVGSNLKPNSTTIVSVITACSDNESVVKELHGYILRGGIDSDLMIRNALVSAYGKCGLINEAQRVFNSSIQKDEVSWNALIACYAQNGLFEESLQLLSDMKHSGFEVNVVTYSGILSSLSQSDLSSEAMKVFDELLSVGLKPDVIAIASILPAISGAWCLDFCKEIHAYSYRHRFEFDRRVQNALVSVYGKCASIQDAERVFEAINKRDVISWSSMIVGYTHNHYFVEGLDTFRKMVESKTEPNTITITSVLSACAGLSGLQLGKEVHSWATKKSLLEGQSFVGSALIDMYAKCGRIGDSRRMFDLMKEKNLVTWNSIIGGYAVHGLGEEALELFRTVKEPDEVSFIAALSACSHGGLVEEGIKIFDSMKDFKISPREGHYACMVDLLARSGRIGEAYDLIRMMPTKASAEIWGVLLGACKMHSNLELAVHSGERIVELGSSHSGYYVLLSNILAEFGRWKEVEAMREWMTEKRVKKNAGCSWIEVNKEFHSFVAKESPQHPEWEGLFRVLGFLSEQMKGMSY